MAGNHSTNNLAEMSADASFNRETEQRNAVAALLYLAAANESERESPLSDEECYGLGVVLKMIATKVENL